MMSIRFNGWLVGVALLGTVGFCEEKEERPLEIPLVKGEDSTGVVIPEHRLDGTLKSRFFSLAVARLVEGSLVEVERSVFESLGKDGGLEVKVTLDLARLDLATRRIRSGAKVLVVTPQYEVTSVGMDFDWAKKEGELRGPVKMTFSRQARLGAGAQGGKGGDERGDAAKNERR